MLRKWQARRVQAFEELRSAHLAQERQAHQNASYTLYDVIRQIVDFVVNPPLRLDSRVPPPEQLIPALVAPLRQYSVEAIFSVMDSQQRYARALAGDSRPDEAIAYLDDQDSEAFTLASSATQVTLADALELVRRDLTSPALSDVLAEIERMDQDTILTTGRAVGAALGASILHAKHSMSTGGDELAAGLVEVGVAPLPQGMVRLELLAAREGFANVARAVRDGIRGTRLTQEEFRASLDNANWPPLVRPERPEPKGLAAGFRDSRRITRLERVAQARSAEITAAGDARRQEQRPGHRPR